MQSISLTIQGRVVLLTRDEIADLGRQFCDIQLRACSVRESWQPMLQKSPGLKNPVSEDLITGLAFVGAHLIQLSKVMDPILSPRATLPCTGA